MQPQQPTAPQATWSNRLAWLGLAVLLAAFVVFVKTYFVPATIEPDDNGYFAQGSLIAKTGKTWFVPESDIQFIGLHWLLMPSGAYVSRYPPGLALVVAAAYSLLDFRASVLVNPLMALLALLGTFVVARRLTTPGWALACTTLLAVNPTFTAHTLNGGSHMVVTALMVWGLALLLRWQDSGKPRDAFWAGLVLGCIPSVRYPEAVLALGVGAFLFASYRRFPCMARHYGAALLGAAVPVVALLVRNQLMFGAFWKTAYVLSHEQTGFSLDFFSVHFPLYLRNLSGEGLRVVFGLGLIGSVWMASDRRLRATGLLLLIGPSCLLLLYMTYYWSGGMPGTMRFMLPTFPLYLAAATWALHSATAQAGWAVRVLSPLVLIGLQVASSGTESLNFAAERERQKQLLAAVTDELERHVQPGSIIVTQGELLQHLDFVRTWRLADESIAQATNSGLLGRFPPRDPPKTPAIEQRLKADLLNEKFGTSREERRSRFLVELKKWAAGAKLYLVTRERSLRFGVAADAPAEALRVVARVPLPRLPQTQGLNSRSGLAPGPVAVAQTPDPDAGVTPPGDQPGAAPQPPTPATNDGDFVIVEWAP